MEKVVQHSGRVAELVTIGLRDDDGDDARLGGYSPQSGNRLFYAPGSSKHEGQRPSKQLLPASEASVGGFPFLSCDGAVQ